MRISYSWIVFSALLTAISGPAQSTNTSIEVRFPEELVYSHHVGDCSPELLNILPITLLFDSEKGKHSLVDMKASNATLSGVPTMFGKEGLSDERAFMMIESESNPVVMTTDHEVGEVLQLWLEREKNTLGPWSSAFYANTDKTCLIMHDLAAQYNPLAKPRR